MKIKKRLTFLEIVALIAVVGVASFFIWSQIAMFSAHDRDTARKADINAIYYNLQMMYYPTHHSYPLSLNESILPGLDPKYLKDPKGHSIGDPLSDMRYEPTGCDESSQCSGYTLRVSLELEADFIKTSN